jgi:hypothetical protein
MRPPYSCVAALLMILARGAPFAATRTDERHYSAAFCHRVMIDMWLLSYQELVE